MTLVTEVRQSVVAIVAALVLSTLCIGSAVSPALSASYSPVVQQG